MPVVKFRAIPEWDRHRLVLIWPVGNRPQLTALYARLLTEVSSLFRVTLLIQNADAVPDIQADISVVRVKNLPDIWLQDYAPIPVQDQKGDLLLAKFKYSPAYLRDLPDVALRDDRIGAKLGSFFSLPTIRIPLVLDGGSMVTNGSGILIATERILSDNPHLSRTEIEFLLQQHLGAEQVLLLPEEPHDPTGHIDGMVRFVDERTILVGRYPDSYRVGHSYGELLKHRLAQELSPDIRIHQVENFFPDPEMNEGIPSAVGNMLNFLQIRKTLFVPSYGLQGEGPVFDNLRRSLPEFRIVPIPHCLPLARLGGVLHCISWQV